MRPKKKNLVFYFSDPGKS